ncbi:hypothetical protein [Natronococcus occultus]|uniref:Glycosyltransferase RgtA/B/C/D-like domain-containing protein n=1 Tax=Natronococcus occultus SP4 TaxID=694430 RepID=L0JYR6_9EURY|nr:hypothetical protein [Natronococcus occultus]AGB37249.1 hypothetical protein Natoc_1438 [Natronococcus occultus SP4]
MLSGMSLSRLQSLRLDTTAAIAGLIVALVLFPLRFFASQIYITTIPIVVGLGCVLYLLAVRQNEDERTLPTLSGSAAMALPSVVTVGMTVMILVTVLQGARTPLFFAVSSAVGTLLFGQILFTSDRDFHRGLVLFQLVLFAFVFRFTALYATPGYVGIDVWTHMTELSRAIAAEGSLGAIDYDKHFASPFFHLFVVASSLVYDVSLRAGLYLSVGVAMPLSILAVYAAADLLVPARWATFAAAAFSVGSYTVTWGIHLIPTSMGLVFFLAIVYALLRVMRTEYTSRDFSLLVLLSVAVVLTHQVSTFIVLVLLGAAFLAQVVFTADPLGLTQVDGAVSRATKPVNLIGLLVFNFGLSIFVWSLTPFREGSFLGTVLGWFSETLAESAGFLSLASTSGSDEDGAAVPEPETTLLDAVVPYVNELGFLLLFGITLVGCLYVVHRRRAEQSVFTLLLGTGIMLFFVLGLPMFGIRNFIPTRWFAFLYALMAILAAIGLRTLSRDLSPAPIVVVLLLVAVLYPGGMLLAAEGNPDNPVFSEQHERLAYDQSELAAVDTVGEMTGSPAGSEIRPEQRLHTDHPYQTVFERTGAFPSTTSATLPEDGVTEHAYVVYRTTQSEDATYFSSEAGPGYVADPSEERLCRTTQATLYDNGDVRFCGPSSVDG